MENAKKRIILPLNNSPPPQTHSEIETAFAAFAVAAEEAMRLTLAVAVPPKRLRMDCLAVDVTDQQQPERKLIRTKPKPADFVS